MSPADEEAPREAPTGRLRHRGGMYGTWMLARREMARYMNVWAQTILPPVVMAGLFLFVFGHALGDRIGEFGGVRYLAFIAPGLVVQGVIQNAYNNTASSLFDSRRAHYIEDILQSPLADWQIVLAHVIAGTSRGVAIGIITLGVAWPVSDAWQLDVPVFLAVLLTGAVAFSLLGILAGVHASRWDHIFVPMTFILTPLIFLGGVFYPVTELPADLELLSRFNPVLYIVDALRASTLGVHDLPVAPSLVGLLAVDIGLYAWVLRVFRTSKRLRG